MFFQSRISHTGPFLKYPKFFQKSFDKTALENCIFISKSLEGLLPSIFSKWFKFSFGSHSHDTRWSNLGYLKISIHLLICHQNVIFHQLRANQLKDILITFFLNRYS